jgi:hypothetical protein
MFEDMLDIKIDRKAKKEDTETNKNELDLTETKKENKYFKQYAKNIKYIEQYNRDNYKRKTIVFKNEEYNQIIEKIGKKDFGTKIKEIIFEKLDIKE